MLFRSFYGHVGAMDVCARALLIAEKMILDGRMNSLLNERYAGWQQPFGKDMLSGKMSLQAVAAQVLERNRDTRPVSGRQELVENWLNDLI